jgi:hypothetical protein
LALSALMVAGYACKGGGSGVTYLTVLQESPEDGRTDVQVETRIGFQVDAPIDEATLSSDSFSVTDPQGAELVGTLELDEDDPSVVVFTPDEPLDVITTFTATITTELAATGGATLEEDYDWEFRTLDSEWGISEWIEPTGNGRSDDQRVVVDAQSNAIAVWEFTTTLTGSNPPTGIWSSRYTRVNLWSPPEQIDAGDGGSLKPDLAVDGAGNGFCVWEERKNDGSQERNIWANRYEVDQSWGTPERIQASVLPSLRPNVAADSEGNAIAIWVELEFPSNLQVVRSRRYEQGTGWTLNEAIDERPTPSVPESVDVQMDGDGNAIAIWAERALPAGVCSLTITTTCLVSADCPVDETCRRDGNGEVLWANRYVPGVGWETARPIKGDPNTRADNARLGLSQNGEAHVVWIQYGDTSSTPFEERRKDIWSVRYMPGSDWAGSDWGEPEPIDNGADGEKLGPAIAVDAAGVAHAVWSQQDEILQNDFRNIYANRYTPGSGWGMPGIIESPSLDPRDDADATQPQVGVNAAGNTFVVWRQDWEDWGSIWSNRIDPGEPWVAENGALIEIISRAGRSPTVVVDDNRHAHAVWMHSVETQVDRVRTNRFE